MSMEGVSVVVCCHNSALRLQQTLYHLIKQQIPEGFNFEIIIVDNNSSDDTVSVATEFWGKNSTPAIAFKIINELQPGLSFARQCGINESKYNFILLCDDDNWLFDNYVYHAFKVLNENKGIGILGGTGIAATEGDQPLPDWFESYKMVYAVGEQAQATGDITTTKGYSYGAGMTIRKEALYDIDLRKSLLTDRVGRSLSSGGDIELCYKVINNGYRIWWDKELKFYHFISAERLKISYVKKFFNDTIGTNLMLHGLLYTANCFPTFFDNKLKRKWHWRILLMIKDFKFFNDSILGNLFWMRIQLREIFFLLKMNVKYNNLFK